MKKFVLAVPVLLMGLTAAGCAAGPRYGYVRTPPPPPRVERYGVAPRAGYVWQDGYWAYRGSGYYWVPGNWVRPPRARAVWVPGHWQQTPRGYAWRPGHWR